MENDDAKLPKKVTEILQPTTALKVRKNIDKNETEKFLKQPWLHKTPQKLPKKYNCIKCDYQCSHSGDFKKHLQTRKHNDYKMITKTPQKYVCECGKHYKYRQGLYTHQKKCNVTIITLEESRVVVKKESDVTQLTGLITTLINENKDLTNKIVEMGKQPTTFIKQQNNFNVLNYLNSHCQDAMNLSDFIEQLQISFDDLLVIKDKGFVSSIEHSFIDKLKNMEQNRRPIHCTDKKRKKVFVKNEDKWMRDNQHKNINKAMLDVNNKQYKTLSDWFKQNPKWNHDTYMEDKCLAIMNNIHGFDDGEIGERNKNKIVNKIVNSTILDKTE